MSYTMLEEKLKMLPEECLDEVSQYVEFILFRQEHKSRKGHSDLNEFFGSAKSLPDGLDLQRRSRDECV